MLSYNWVQAFANGRQQFRMQKWAGCDSAHPNNVYGPGKHNFSQSLRNDLTTEKIFLQIE